MGIIAWIVVGGIAGWLASMVMKTDRQQGLVMDIVVGIVGGLLGGFVLNLLDVGGDVSGINVESIVVAFIGAVILLAVLRYLTGRR